MAATNELHVVILAAGQGKRMRSNLPKVMQLMAGKPLLGHVLDRARTLRPQAIHIVFGHGGDSLREHFGAAPDVHWAEQAEQLGTGHAVQMALPQIPNHAQVLVMYGDSPLSQTDVLQALLDQPVALLSAVVDDPSGYGRIMRDSAGDVESIVEHRDCNEQQLAVNEVNSGILTAPAGKLSAWLDSVKADNDQGEYYLTDVIALARSDGATVGAVVAEDPNDILGANDRWQLAQLERIYQRRQARRLADDGARLADPERIDVRGEVSVGNDVFIDINTVFQGEVAIGEGSQIGPGAVLIDCHLGPNTRIAPHCVLDGVITEGDCDIGPFARLRPGTRLAGRTRIGNFVETKKTELGAGSKVNHLSYVGDAIVGERVNVGAGTITCNYDGANKHQTVIEDDAFIGSDTQLIAPVTVEKGATIGAGTTVTKTAPAEQLTLSRGKQVSIAGWQRPKKNQS